MSILTVEDRRRLQERYTGGMGGLSEEAYACAPDVLQLLACVDQLEGERDDARAACADKREQVKELVRERDEWKRAAEANMALCERNTDLLAEQNVQLREALEAMLYDVTPIDGYPTAAAVRRAQEALALLDEEDK